MANRTVHGVDLGRIEDAVRAAERRTSGEIRVALARFYFWGDVTRAARRAFAHLRMDRTRERNGVLIFVAPWRRRFAVIGDSGIDERVGAPFWEEIARLLGESFKAGDVNGGLARAIDAVGDRLAALFPIDAAGSGAHAHAHMNQLPDSVALEQGGGGRRRGRDKPGGGG